MEKRLKWLRPKTIKQKLFLIYVGLLVLPVFLVGYYISTEIRANQIQTKTEEIEQDTIRTATELTGTLEAIIRVSDWIYQDERLAEIVRADYSSPYAFFETYQSYPQFNDYLKYYREISHIRVYVDNPSIMSSVGLYPLSQDVKDSEWYQEAIEKRGQIIWRYMKDPVTRDVHLNLTRALYDYDELIGVLSIAVSNDKITEILQNSGNTFFLTLDDELIFSHPKLEDIQSEYDQYRLLLEEQETDQNIKGTANDITFTIQQLAIPKVLHSEFKAVGTVPTSSIVAEANGVLIVGYIAILFVFLFTLILLAAFIRSFNNRVLQLQESMTKVAHGDFDIPSEIPGEDEITEVYEQLYVTMESLQLLLAERYQYEIDRKDAEFKLLSSQINPHFLYNTLEMIRMKAFKNQDREVADIVKLLSKLMRKALERPQDQLPLSEDLTFIDMYLQIQKLRFGERINYDIKQETTQDYAILPLLIQPIVENAFVHGLERISGRAELTVLVKEVGEDLHIIVSDNGVGIPSDKLKQLQAILEGYQESSRVGINNVQQRIKYFYGEDYGMTIESTEGKGTTVKVVIPQRK